MTVSAPKKNIINDYDCYSKLAVHDHTSKALGSITQGEEESAGGTLRKKKRKGFNNLTGLYS